MLRRAVGTAVAILALFILSAGVAHADASPYPAPPVTNATTNDVTSSSATIPMTSPDCACAALPNTGVGFNMGATLAIGGAILAAGVVLVVLGSRRARRH